MVTPIAFFRTHSNLGVPVVKLQIFEVSGATADSPLPLILSGASRSGNWTLSTRFRFRK